MPRTTLTNGLKKVTFFRGSMRFVRVPPYESEVKLTNFVFSWQDGEFFWGKKCCTLFHTKNEESVSLTVKKTLREVCKKKGKIMVFYHTPGGWCLMFE